MIGCVEIAHLGQERTLKGGQGMKENAAYTNNSQLNFSCEQSVCLGLIVVFFLRSEKHARSWLQRQRVRIRVWEQS